MENLSVILVDDHQLFREGLTLLLSNYKNIGSIKEAASGEEFLDLLKEGRPDIIFMDINMPGIGGRSEERRVG